MFLILMVVGLAGLLAMALPVFARHGGGGRVGHGPLHGGPHVAKLGPLRVVGAAAKAAGAPGQALVRQAGPLAATESPTGFARFIPSPRLVFSLLALYGAFGNALVGAAHLGPLAAALLAVVPAAVVEKLAVTPLWRLLFRFEGQPSSPLEELVLSDAIAVTAFRNGRGIVSLVRDGRAVQFSARLIDKHARMEIRVGDRLRVEDLDARRERLTVSVPED